LNEIEHFSKVSKIEDSVVMAFLGADVVGCDIRLDVCGFVKRLKKFVNIHKG